MVSYANALGKVALQTFNTLNARLKIRRQKEYPIRGRTYITMFVVIRNETQML